ncbi:class A beta-lactamase-related serine hydrolase [Rhizobium sp. CG4]|jgi:beta-lactamase class A|uniref:serine hydrolase n=1 Tax=Rhizobium/Agrobacterium group TaxID=227290 RepID=UPI0020349086|nr:MULTISPECIES: class A beta-lactamase-related serine hydrolase [Rhizobium/Agrobacterium group]MCM2457357.1 class A beta-lactamase-related serine hydrolase [Rhizobium sp. CG4]MDO5897336.1 class A beta-lactamase-related serine hydrolase [Agrobacterium sp. Azo12]
MDMSVNTAAAATALEAICNAQPFTTRFMVRNLLTGETIGRGEDEETPSASTRKTSIMMAALKAVHEGRLDLDEQIVYEQRFSEEVASGMFRYLTPGIVISLRDAITGMMVLSDNVCTKMVFERLQLSEVDSYCKSIGMSGTHHRFLIPPLALSPDHTLTSVTTTTARDQVFLLQTILDAQTSPEAAELLGSSMELCAYALQTLKNQILRYAIPSRLPFGTLVAHKGGTGKRGRMNAGIVYRDGAPFYIIAAFTDQVPQAMADGTPGYTVSLETIGRLSRVCWDQFQQ